MIKSMTGFGRSELKSAQGLIRVEIKTTNHKFLEVSSRLPSHLAEFEDAVRKLVAGQIRRGKATLFVSCPDPAVYSTRLFLNEGLAKEVFHKIRRLRNLLKMGPKAGDPRAQEVVLREVLRYPDVLTKDTSHDRGNFFSRELTRAVAAAMDNLKSSRALEGRALERDFRNRLREISTAVRMIEKRLPVLGKEYRKGLSARMKEFVKNGDIDRERLTLEVALYLKNSDISEELTRLKSHEEALSRALREKGELGRKLDFIAQEMTRESNTMGAKSSDAVISGEVIRIKSAIEKIREQAQNVE